MLNVKKLVARSCQGVFGRSLGEHVLDDVFGFVPCAGLALVHIICDASIHSGPVDGNLQ